MRRSCCSVCRRPALLHLPVSALAIIITSPLRSQSPPLPRPRCARCSQKSPPLRRHISYNALAQPTHNHAMPDNATGLTMVHTVPYANSPRSLTVKHNIQDNNRSHRPRCRAAFPSMQAVGIRARGCRQYYRLVSFQPWRAVPDRGMCARSPIHLDFM
jgi:hypothetical protein